MSKDSNSIRPISDSLPVRALLLLGPAYIVVLFIGAATAGYVPPLGPATSADQLAAHYQKYQGEIRVASLLVRVAALFWSLWTVGIHSQLARIPDAPLGALLLQGSGGMLFGAALLAFSHLMAMATYRAQRDAALVELLNDYAWLGLYSSLALARLQLFGLSWALYSDSRPKPLVPRATAWVAPAAALYSLLSVFVPFTHGGPMAWDGYLSFHGSWVVALAALVPLPLSMWQSTGDTDKSD